MSYSDDETTADPNLLVDRLLLAMDNENEEIALRSTHDLRQLFVDNAHSFRALAEMLEPTLLPKPLRSQIAMFDDAALGDNAFRTARTVMKKGDITFEKIRNALKVSTQAPPEDYEELVAANATLQQQLQMAADEIQRLQKRLRPPLHKRMWSSLSQKASRLITNTSKKKNDSIDSRPLVLHPQFDLCLTAVGIAGTCVSPLGSFLLWGISARQIYLQDHYIWANKGRDFFLKGMLPFVLPLGLVSFVFLKSLEITNPTLITSSQATKLAWDNTAAALLEKQSGSQEICVNYLRASPIIWGKANQWTACVSMSAYKRTSDGGLYVHILTNGNSEDKIIRFGIDFPDGKKTILSEMTPYDICKQRVRELVNAANEEARRNDKYPDPNAVRATCEPDANPAKPSL